MTDEEKNSSSQLEPNIENWSQLAFYDQKKKGKKQLWKRTQCAPHFIEEMYFESLDWRNPALSYFTNDDRYICFNFPFEGNLCWTGHQLHQENFWINMNNLLVNYERSCNLSRKKMSHFLEGWKLIDDKWTDRSKKKKKTFLTLFIASSFSVLIFPGSIPLPFNSPWTWDQI